MNQVEVTLIIAVHGAAGYLPVFAASLQAQTHANFEAIFVVDTADTESISVLAPLLDVDTRLRLLPCEWPAWRGTDAAWSRGIRAARGAFVAFASPQDLLPPGSLETRFAACKQHAAVVRGCVEYVHLDGTREQVETPQKAQGKAYGGDPGLTLNDFLQAPWGWMLPTGLLRRNNPFTYVPGVDPLALVTRCMWLPDVVYSRVRRLASRQVRSRVREQAQALLQVTLAAEQSVHRAFAGALAELPALQADIQVANGDAGLVEAFGAAVLGGVHRFKGGDNTLAEFGRQLAALKARAATRGRGEKLEIAIFPYKSCVFDSVESIWRAAAADPDCDAHLVPIPYFERLPDGTFTRMCYEGADFPHDVPVEDWRDYDVKVRHPDVVIIHNPWDDTNGLTSVHPAFYARRLKDLTDLLVYVPYFVTVDDNLGAFYACHPGALYAARVVVQSEDVRKQYIEYFKEFEEKYGCRGRFGVPEEKFVALGSPKYDKLTASQQTPLALPEAWQKLLMRPDGSRKPAVFYNTSVVHIGPYGAQYIEKIRQTIEDFAERDDVVLWWRPHPLAMPEMKRCHPELAAAYADMVEGYKNAGKGIYDETPEPYMALTETQGYYGDVSSLVEMYRISMAARDCESTDEGKRPILLQNIKMTKNNGHIFNVRVFDICVIEDDLWALDAQGKGLLRIDLNSGASDYICTLENNDTPQVSYIHIGNINNILYFVPFAADNIGMYDVNYNKFTVLSLNFPEYKGRLKYDSGKKFRNVFAYKQYLYFTGFTWPGILRLDTETGEQKPLHEIAAKIDALGESLDLEFEDAYFREAQCLDGRMLVLPVCCVGAVAFFDMETCHVELCTIGDGYGGYVDVCCNDDTYWLTGMLRQEIVCWRKRDNHIMQIAPPAGGNGGKGKRTIQRYPYSEITRLGEDVWVFPLYFGTPFYLDAENKAHILDNLERFFPPESVSEKIAHTWHFAKIIDEILYLQTAWDNRLYAYNLQSQDIREYTVSCDCFAMKQQSATVGERERGFVSERCGVSLTWLRKCLSGMNVQCKGGNTRETMAPMQTIGERIYSYFKKIHEKQQI